MRPLLTSLAATLALASPALARTAAESDRLPVLPTAAGYAPATGLSFDGTPEVTRKGGSIFSARGVAVGGDVDWTGVYLGGQLGAAFGDSDASGDDESVIGGITLGYDHDFGEWVIGGGLDYDFTDIDIAPGSSLEEIFRVKLRAGPKIGRGLLYGTGGHAYGDSDNAGDENGWFIGGGYEYLVNDQFSVGGEVLYHEFDGFNGTGNDVEATTVQVRATFRF